MVTGIKLTDDTDGYNWPEDFEKAKFDNVLFLNRVQKFCESHLKHRELLAAKAFTCAFNSKDFNV